MEFSLNEIDLCADWKDKYQISLQNRARKYIYVEYLYEIILILDLLAAFVSRIYAIELIFPLDLTGWKQNPLQKNRVQMQWCISLLFTEQCLLTWWALCLSISKMCFSKKKTPIVSHYIEDCILTRKKYKIKVIRPLLHKHTMISSSIKE